MKADLITIFPGIVLATEIWDDRQLKFIKDSNVLDDIVYNKTRIVSYKKLASKSKPEDLKYLKEINLIQPNIIDHDSNPLDDFTVIIDKDIKINSLKPPTCSSQHLITYFSLLRGLDHLSTLGFIKILRFHGGGCHLSVNNKHKHFREKLFFLPYKPSALQKLLIHKESEKVLIDVLRVSHEKKPKTNDRILNAIALFNESCRINVYNPNSAIVLMVSAFEALLRLPKSSTDNFGYAFKTLWQYDDDIEEWAKQLYQLRCCIVHGKVVEGEKLLVRPERHYPYFQIARDIFHTCLLSVLQNYGYIVIEKKSKDKKIKKFKSLIASNKEKVDWLIKHRKNFTYKSFLKNPDLYQNFLTKVEEFTSTDYSAEHLIEKLLNHIWLIVKDWIDDERKKNPNVLVEKWGMKIDEAERHIKFMNDKYDEILKTIGEIKSVNFATKGRYMIDDKIGKIHETIRQLEPGVYSYNEKFPFTIGVFLSGCLHSLF